MRRITVKYAGECRACGAAIDHGEQAFHEKRVGLFCAGCEPEDGSDELRAYRQEGLDARNERLAERAEKRRAKAESLRQRDAHLWDDYAFITQPGHIPERARAIKRSDKAHELDREAAALDRKRSRGNARVKGDAAKRDEQRREAVREWLEPGMKAHTGHFGVQQVVKVNRKTARIRFADGHECTHDLIFFKPAQQQESNNG